MLDVSGKSSKRHDRRFIPTDVIQFCKVQQLEVKNVLKRVGSKPVR